MSNILYTLGLNLATGDCFLKEADKPGPISCLTGQRAGIVASQGDFPDVTPENEGFVWMDGYSFYSAKGLVSGKAQDTDEAFAGFSEKYLALEGAEDHIETLSSAIILNASMTRLSLVPVNPTGIHQAIYPFVKDDDGERIPVSISFDWSGDETFALMEYDLDGKRERVGGPIRPESPQLMDLWGTSDDIEIDKDKSETICGFISPRFVSTPPWAYTSLVLWMLAASGWSNDDAHSLGNVMLNTSMEAS